MLEQYFKKLIYGFLSNIIEDFSENEIELSKWKGSFELMNLRIRKQFIFDLGAKIGFPLHSESGVIERVQITIPWTKIKSQPIVISIKGIHIVCQTQAKFSKEFEEKRRVALKYDLLQEMIKKFEDSVRDTASAAAAASSMDDISASEDRSGQQSQAASLTTAPQNFLKKQLNYYTNYLHQIKDIILENLRFDISDFQIKLKDGITMKKDQMQIGIGFDRLIISPANSEFEQDFVSPEQRKKEQKKYQIYKLEGLSIFESHSLLLESPSIRSKINSPSDKSYILHPVNIDITSVQNSNKTELATMFPQQQTRISFSEIRVDFTEKTFKHIQRLLALNSWHNESGDTLYLRPNYGIRPTHDARRWLVYLFYATKARVDNARSAATRVTLMQSIRQYIEAYKLKTEHEIQQRLAQFKFSTNASTTSTAALSDFQQQHNNKMDANKKVDITDLEKQLEELERTLLFHPITPEDIMHFRDLARHQCRTEKNNLFEKLLIQESNKNKSAAALSLIQQAQQQQEQQQQQNSKKHLISNMFSWIGSKILRKNNNNQSQQSQQQQQQLLLPPVDSNENLEEEQEESKGDYQRTTERIIDVDELAENEELLKREFNEFIESYTEGHEFVRDVPLLPGEKCVRNQTSIVLDNRGIVISLVQLKYNNFVRAYSKIDVFQIKILVDECCIIATDTHTVLRLSLQDIHCQHSINPNEIYQSTFKKAEQLERVPSLKLKFIREKDINSKTQRMCLHIATADHSIVCTDVLISSLAHFLSIPQPKSGEYFTEFHNKISTARENRMTPADLRKKFLGDLLFETIDIKLGRIHVLFPESFSNSLKPQLAFSVESVLISNKELPAAAARLTTYQEHKTRKFSKFHEKSPAALTAMNKLKTNNIPRTAPISGVNHPISNTIVPSTTAITGLHLQQIPSSNGISPAQQPQYQQQQQQYVLHRRQSEYHRNDPNNNNELFQSILNAPSYHQQQMSQLHSTVKTDMFHSIIDQPSFLNHSQRDICNGFDDLNSLADEAHSEDEDNHIPHNHHYNYSNNHQIGPFHQQPFLHSQNQSNNMNNEFLESGMQSRLTTEFHSFFQQPQSITQFQEQFNPSYQQQQQQHPLQNDFQTSNYNGNLESEQQPPQFYNGVKLNLFHKILHKDYFPTQQWPDPKLQHSQQPNPLSINIYIDNISVKHLTKCTASHFQSPVNSSEELDIVNEFSVKCNLTRLFSEIPHLSQQQQPSEQQLQNEASSSPEIKQQQEQRLPNRSKSIEFIRQANEITAAAAAAQNNQNQLGILSTVKLSIDMTVTEIAVNLHCAAFHEIDRILKVFKKVLKPSHEHKHKYHHHHHHHHRHDGFIDEDFEEDIIAFPRAHKDHHQSPEQHNSHQTYHEQQQQQQYNFKSNENNPLELIAGTVEPIQRSSNGAATAAEDDEFFDAVEEFSQFFKQQSSSIHPATNFNNDNQSDFLATQGPSGSGDDTPFPLLSTNDVRTTAMPLPKTSATHHTATMIPVAGNAVAATANTGTAMQGLNGIAAQRGNQNKLNSIRESRFQSYINLLHSKSKSDSRGVERFAATNEISAAKTITTSAVPSFTNLRMKDVLFFELSVNLSSITGNLITAPRKKRLSETEIESTKKTILSIQSITFQLDSASNTISTLLSQTKAIEKNDDEIPLSHRDFYKQQPKKEQVFPHLIGLKIKIESITINVQEIDQLLLALHCLDRNELNATNYNNNSKSNANTNRQNPETDQKIEKNLLLLIFCRDSAFEVSVQVAKCACILSQNFRKAHATTESSSSSSEQANNPNNPENALFSLNLEQISLKSETPIHFDLSFFRPFDHLLTLEKYLHANIRLAWTFEAQYYNSTNKHLEPCVEPIQSNMQFIQDKTQASLEVDCANSELMLNLHPAMLNNALLLLHDIKRLTEPRDSEKIKKKLLHKQPISSFPGGLATIPDHNHQTTPLKKHLKSQTNQQKQEIKQFRLINTCGVSLEISSTEPHAQKSSNSSAIREFSTCVFKKHSTSLSKILLQTNEEITVEFTRLLPPNNVKQTLNTNAAVNSSSFFSLTNTAKSNCDIFVSLSSGQSKRSSVIDLNNAKASTTAIAFSEEISIICECIEESNHSTVFSFRSNVRLINETDLQLSLFLHDAAVIQPLSLKYQVPTRSRPTECIISSKQSMQYIPVDSLSRTFVQVTNANTNNIVMNNNSKSNQIFANNSTTTLKFKDHLALNLPICALVDIEEDPFNNSTHLLSNQQQQPIKKKQQCQEHIVIRKILNNQSSNNNNNNNASGNVSSHYSQKPKRKQSSVAQDTYQVDASKEITLVISYPVKFLNLNPLPLNIDFSFPNQFESFTKEQILVDTLINKFTSHSSSSSLSQFNYSFGVQESIILEQQQEQQQQQKSVWDKKLKYASESVHLQAGEEKQVSCFNAFQACNVRVELNAYSQFKPIELMDPRTTQTFMQCLLALNSEEDHSHFAPNNPFLKEFKDQKILQLLDPSGNQINLLLNVHYSYATLLVISVQAQYWILNETDIPLAIIVKEDRYIYSDIHLPGHSRETPSKKLQSSQPSNSPAIQVTAAVNTTTGKVSSGQEQQIAALATPLKKSKKGGVEINSLSTKLHGAPGSASGTHGIATISGGSAQKPLGFGVATQNTSEIAGTTLITAENLASENESLYGIDSCNVSEQELLALFARNGDRLGMFTGNSSSTKWFSLKVRSSELERSVCASESIVTSTQSQSATFSSEYFSFDEESETNSSSSSNTNTSSSNSTNNSSMNDTGKSGKATISFKALKYMGVRAQQIVLPEKYGGISFFVIVPVYIIKNLSLLELSVKMTMHTGKLHGQTALHPYTTRQLFCEAGTGFPCVQLKPANNFSLWSQKFPVNKSNQFTIKINHINSPSSFILLRITISREAHTYLVSIEDSIEYPPFKLINMTQEELAVCQRGHQGSSIFVRPQSLNNENHHHHHYIQQQQHHGSSRHMNQLKMDVFEESFKQYQSFGWDDPFGEEIIVLSSVERQVCALTRHDLTNKQSTSRINGEYVVKTFNDNEYPNTKVILIMYEKNAHLFDLCQLKDHSSTFSVNVNLHKLGISLVDSHPRELLYFQVDLFSLKFKSHRKRVEVCVDISDIQGDFQAAKPFPAPFLMTKRGILKKEHQKTKQEQQQKQSSSNAQTVATNTTNSLDFLNIFTRITSLFSSSVRLSQPSQSSLISKAAAASQASRISNKRSQDPPMQSPSPQQKQLKRSSQQLDEKQIQQEASDNNSQTDEQQSMTSKESNLTNKIQHQENINNQNELGEQQQVPSGQQQQQQQLQQQAITRKTNKKSFFVMNYIQQDYKSTSINHIERFSVEFQPIEIIIDGALIHKMTQLFNEVQFLVYKNQKQKAKKEKRVFSSKGSSLILGLPASASSSSSLSSSKIPNHLSKRVGSIPAGIGVTSAATATAAAAAAGAIGTNITNQNSISNNAGATTGQGINPATNTSIAATAAAATPKQPLQKFLIERLDIQAISVDISFKNLHASQFVSPTDSSTITSFVMTLLNLIGSNQFFFQPFHSENHLYSATDLLRAITRFYTGLIEKQIFNILANANLIGNPGQLFKEIAHACIDFANTIFDEVHRSEVLFHEDKLFLSAFKNGYALTKRVAQAFKRSAQVISKSIISELFDHVDEQEVLETPSFASSIATAAAANGNSPARNPQSRQNLLQEVRRMQNFQGSFVNLFHAAVLVPFSTPYSLNSLMFKKLHKKLDTKKVKSLLPYLKFRRFPRAVVKANNHFALVAYDHEKSLGKLFFEAFNLVEFDEFENIIETIYRLSENRILYITKDRFVVVDENMLKIALNVAKSDMSNISIERFENCSNPLHHLNEKNARDATTNSYKPDQKMLRFKYCSQNHNKNKQQVISMKILNLEEASFPIDFSPEITTKIQLEFTHLFKSRMSMFF